MVAERHRKPTALDADAFTRTGYTFVDWNTVANGSGAHYANGALYSFSASISLFAQWKMIKKVAPQPANSDEVVIGTFALTSTALSPALEREIQGLADKVKGKGQSQIALLGYGDPLMANQNSATDRAVNLELGRMRAQEVATYLEGRLSALGRTGWTISITASGVGSSNANQYVIVTLS